MPSESRPVEGDSMHSRRFRRRPTSSMKSPCQGYCTSFLAAFMVGGFIVFNVRYFHQRKFHVLSLKQKSLRARDQWVSPLSQQFNLNRAAENARNLIIVAGHSVTTSGHLEDADQDELDWFLLPYQKEKGLPNAIVAHISAGIEAASRDPESLLVFSGGETRPAAGPDTEGSSYFRVADAMNLWPANANVRSRALAEEFARDSFENLLFSICRFYEVTKKYPEKITVVSFSFKETRFSAMHAKALRWPDSKFYYVGVDPDPSSGFDLAESTKGEMENARRPFEDDPYGCSSPVLQVKRKERNPFHRTPPYLLSCPDMKELLQYCGPSLFPAEKIPWK
ncbi:hypothetical protein ACA910_003328 [Epithemia clementina (nom. ined.)]